MFRRTPVEPPRLLLSLLPLRPSFSKRNFEQAELGSDAAKSRWRRLDHWLTNRLAGAKGNHQRAEEETR